ncbi:MAG: pyrroline-5-carboxylate reductase [Christensenellales bacterium]
MAKYKFGFIGLGNMGGALAAAACADHPARVIVANRTQARAEAFAEKYGCAVGTFEEAARESEYVILGMLPGAVCEVASRVYPAMRASGDRRVLVSMAAGVSLAQLQACTNDALPIIRIIPNTPVAVGKGLILYAANEHIDADTIADFTSAMSCAGTLDPLPESLFYAGSAVAGCGPAFAAMFIDALADGGVKAGLPRAKAIAYAAQMLRGAAELAIRTGDHPGALKDAVCSPGGSTIEGVQALEEGGFRAAVMRAVVAAWEKHR